MARNPSSVSRTAAYLYILLKVLATIFVKFFVGDKTSMPVPLTPTRKATTMKVPIVPNPIAVVLSTYLPKRRQRNCRITI